MLFKAKIYRPYMPVFVIVEDTDMQAVISHIIEAENILVAEILSVKVIFTEKN